MSSKIGCTLNVSRSTCAAIAVAATSLYLHGEYWRWDVKFIDAPQGT